MSWVIYRIYEDDYGCEERDESQPEMVLLLLHDEAGNQRMLRVEESRLTALGLDEGSCVAVDEAGELRPL